MGFWFFFRFLVERHIKGAKKCSQERPWSIFYVAVFGFLISHPLCLSEKRFDSDAKGFRYAIPSNFSGKANPLKEQRDLVHVGARSHLRILIGDLVGMNRSQSIPYDRFRY